MPRHRVFGAAVAVAAIASACTPAALRVSVPSSAVESNGPSSAPRVNSDGTSIVFDSTASNLVAGDTNAVSDVFVRDTTFGTTERVVGASGQQPNGASRVADVSDEARYVVITSAADNLGPADGNHVDDVYVRDRVARTTMLISQNAAGQAANGPSTAWAMTPNGTAVLFWSSATDLKGATGPGAALYVAKLATRSIMQVAAPEPCEPNWSPSLQRADMSADATRLLYVSQCDNTMGSGRIQKVIAKTVGQSPIVLDTVESFIEGSSSFDNVDAVDLADDASIYAWATDGMGHGGTALSDLALWTGSGPVQHLFPTTGAFDVAVSHTGRYIAYTSARSTTPSGPWPDGRRVLVLDRATNETRDATLNTSAGTANGNSQEPAFSTDDATIAFSSFASDIVSGDTNGVEDVFTRPVPALFGATAPTAMLLSH